MKHRAMKFACSMGFYAMVDRLVWPSFLSRDCKWPYATKCTHLRVVGLRLEGTLVWYWCKNWEGSDRLSKTLWSAIHNIDVKSLSAVSRPWKGDEMMSIQMKLWGQCCVNYYSLLILFLTRICLYLLSECFTVLCSRLFFVGVCICYVRSLCLNDNGTHNWYQVSINWFTR